jgi:hypothetical protein
MSKEPGSYRTIPTRLLSPEEQDYVRTIVSSNPKWSDVSFGNLFATAACTCGCHSIVIEAPPHPQNPKLVGHQGLVGGIELGIRADEKDEVVSVLLHFTEGSLSLLEIVWYNFPKPVPAVWIETERRVYVE